MNTAMRYHTHGAADQVHAVANQPDTAITRPHSMIRGQKVMLDRDLAELYGAQVKRLKQQVRRNASASRRISCSNSPKRVRIL
jgi:hypothetical protein